MKNVQLEVHCPRCLDAHYHQLDLGMTMRGWDIICDECPHCQASLLVEYALYARVEFVRLVNAQYPVVLGVET